MSGEQYSEDYFLRGVETCKSLYTDYRWMPEQTVPMCERIAAHIGVTKGERVLDFGCARGYVVKALRGLGYDAWGLDISEWAIRNADEDTKPYLNWTTNSPPVMTQEFDWIIAKDVLEHVPYVLYAIDALMKAAKKGLFVVVPLSTFDNHPYTIPDYEKDVTHIQRHRLVTWVEMFLRAGWSVEASYRVPGIKDSWYKPGWEMGNGFITARRVGI